MVPKYFLIYFNILTIINYLIRICKSQLDFVLIKTTLFTLVYKMF